MKSTRENNGGIKGLLVSVLLHGIFFASLMALDIDRSSPTVPAADSALETSPSPVESSSAVAKVKTRS